MASTQANKPSSIDNANTRAFLNKHLSENYPNKNLPSLTEAQVNEIVKAIESALIEKQKNKQGGSKDNSNIPIKAQAVTDHAQNKGKPVGNHKGTNNDTDTETESESEIDTDTDDETPKKTAHPVASHTHKPVTDTGKFKNKGPVLPPQKLPAKNNKVQNSDTETESDTDDETPKKTAHPVPSNTKEPVPSFTPKGPLTLPAQNVPAKTNYIHISDTETESDSD